MTTNLFEPTPPAPEEAVEVLFKSATTRIERIVSWGQTSPPGFWYNQDETEWVTLLSGSATVQFEDARCHHLTPGDHLLIPTHLRHRVTHTDRPTIWLCVFFS